MKILIILLFLSSVFTLSACTTTLKPKIVHPHTPLSAAKDFVDALTSGSTVELNQVTYTSQSMPTDKIMGIAKLRHIVGMDLKRFTYTVDPHDQSKQTILVSFKDENNVQDTWKLIFLENTNKVYQYAGYLSGTLFANTTVLEATRSYAEILKYDGDKDWYNDFAYDKSKRGSGVAPDEARIKKYHFNEKKMSDFNIGKKVLVYSQGMRVPLIFKDSKSQVHQMINDFRREEDGFYYSGSWLRDPNTKLKVYKETDRMHATIKFMNALYTGVIQPCQLTHPELADQIILMGEERKITGMKWGYDYNPDPKMKNAVTLNFKSPTGGSNEDYEFVFKKNKAGIEEFDTDASGTLLDNRTPEKTGESYVKALIQNANAFQLKSLILPSKRGTFTSDKTAQFAAKYHLLTKTLNDFKITSQEQNVSIQFKGSDGKEHSIHLTTEEWKDGYYIVSHQFN